MEIAHKSIREVSGNVTDALRVLKVTLEGPQKNAHFFDLELSLVDPENPVTQISKTPSDEEFPWCGEDTDADVPSTIEEQEQISKHEPAEGLDMSNTEKISTDEQDKPEGEGINVVEHTDEIEPKNVQVIPIEEEVKPQEDSIQNELPVQEQRSPKTSNEDTEDKKSEKTYLNIADETGESSSKPNTEMDELQVPKEEEMDRGSEIQSDVAEDPEKEKKEKEEKEKKEKEEKEKKEKEEKVMSNYKMLAFPKRPRSMIKSELLVKEVKKFIEDMKRQTAPEDLDVRIIPSNMACRFDLPIDLTRLKGECPLSYLRTYCQVTDSRKTVYREKFEQHKTEKAIRVSNLRKIYENLYRVSGLQYEVMHLQRLLGLDLSMELDMETFTVVSCLMERIMLKSQGRGPAQGYKKNIFEVTNFSALNGKLHGTEITPQMMDLLKYIRGT